MNTLDILLCAGNGIFSRIIQRTNKIAGYKGESAEISHVAMVVKLSWETIMDLWYRGIMKIRPIRDLNDLYVFESTTRNKWCNKSGVQINPYDLWLKNYPGKVYIRRLHCKRPDGVAEWMTNQVGRPYENGLGGILELATIYSPISRSWLGKSKPGRWVLGRLRTPEIHCTEEDGLCLQHFGMMTNKVAANKLPPPFWWGEGLDNILNCRIDEPEEIKA